MCRSCSGRSSSRRREGGAAPPAARGELLPQQQMQKLLLLQLLLATRGTSGDTEDLLMQHRMQKRLPSASRQDARTAARVTAADGAHAGAPARGQLLLLHLVRQQPALFQSLVRQVRDRGEGPPLLLIPIPIIIMAAASSSSPPSPPLHDDTTYHISDDTFRRQTLLSLGFILPISSLPFLVADDADPLSSVHWHWTLSPLVRALKLSAAAYALLSLRGYYVWSRGPLPSVRDEEARYVDAGDGRGRAVEYYVYGSEREDASVVVLLHGSGATGKYFNQYSHPDRVLKELNVRAVSPSYPGHGGSDPHAYRRIADWPITDLIPILTKEGVDGFHVIGTSYGTAHAMATAAALPDRCLSMGLNAPYLPESICREANVWTDADMILRESKLENPWILLPILAIFGFVQGLIPTAICSYPEGKKIVKESPDLFEVLKKDAARSFLRGVNGQVYEMLNAETTQTWPDPRHIATKNIALWYALDDSIVPPEHGMWLEMTFRKQEGRNVHVKRDKSGLGHFSH